jgi:CRISPR-associated exonuclease Cas4
VYRDEDLLPISALQHFLFCERQCALIHIEGLWAENRLTVEGRAMHQRADRGEQEHRGGLRIVRGLLLQSTALGLTGRADAVEFHPGGTILPVEYKRGRPKLGDHDRVQLCAQGLCLEEMHGRAISRGALFYGRTRRREEVVFDERLRRATREAVERTHALLRSGRTPRARREPKCEQCSLLELCLPDAMSLRQSAARWVERTLAASLAGGAPADTGAP